MNFLWSCACMRRDGVKKASQSGEMAICDPLYMLLHMHDLACFLCAVVRMNIFKCITAAGRNCMQIHAWYNIHLHTRSIHTYTHNVQCAQMLEEHEEEIVKAAIEHGRYMRMYVLCMYTCAHTWMYVCIRINAHMYAYTGAHAHQKGLVWVWFCITCYFVCAFA